MQFVSISRVISPESRNIALLFFRYGGVGSFQVPQPVYAPTHHSGIRRERSNEGAKKLTANPFCFEHTMKVLTMSVVWSGEVSDNAQCGRKTQEGRWVLIEGEVRIN